MRPADWKQNGGDDVVAARNYLRQLHAWEAERDRLAGIQTSRRTELDAAEQRLAILNGWRSRWQDLVSGTSARATRLAVDQADVNAATSSIATVEGEMADFAQAREIATARLLGGIPSTTPIVLLPMRLETHWDGPTLHVRFYPDVVSIDAHDPRLSATEVAAGERYWQTRAAGQPADVDQAWSQLVRGLGAQRAAWIVRATDPQAAAQPTIRPSGWSTAVKARLLPDRFAVVLLSAGQPVNVAAIGAPARYLTWSSPLSTDPLPVGVLSQPGSPTWMTDLANARAQGMAVSIPIPQGVRNFDALVVAGLRTAAADLASLLDTHCYTDGLEVLADGAPSNNSSQIRAYHTATKNAAVARDLIDPNPPAPLADGSAGAQLATLLGLPRARLAAVAGAAQSRAAPIDAARLLVGLGTRGALHGALGEAGASAWPVVTPSGPAATLRIGRQPYGVLPVTAPGRWQSRAGEAGRALASAMRDWGLATGPPAMVDPLAPPTHLGDGSARHATATDDSPLAQLLLEAGSTLRWSANNTIFTGVAGIVGPPDGPQAPSAYLMRIAEADPSALAGIAATLPAALFARIAFAAKQRTADPGGPPLDQVNAALRRLAPLAATASGHADLARVIGDLLDAMSHRFDAWIVGAATERLNALRAANPANMAIGAFGWLTDLRPQVGTRSYGHVHAPSPAHAATAAVLRSGFLGQRRQGWAARLARAQGAGNAAGAAEATTGLDTLTPLDAQTESRLPLALDLSSRPVREARRTLAAIRVGQPLGAVLGYQFERDLADAGMQRYLAAFRKLTRFHTGSALEQAEAARRDAAQKLAQMQSQLAVLQRAASTARARVTDANADLSAATARQHQAEQQASQYVAMQGQLSQVTNQIPGLQAALAAVDAARPAVGRRRAVIQVPNV